MINNSTTIKKKTNKVAVIEFTPGHDFNPFSSTRMEILKDDIQTLGNDSEVNSIILYGGEGKSFSAGGDFNEVNNFTGGDEVDVWLERVNTLYKAVLSCPKPVIAAIDGYAIGFGLQLAITCDYRIGSDSCILQMPEFAMDISCNFGGYMLERIVGRGNMQNIVFGCEKIYAQEALHTGLLSKIVAQKSLLPDAIIIAEKFASYANTPVRETKATINRPFISGLDEICKLAKYAHRQTFALGKAQDKMRKIIK